MSSINFIDEFNCFMRYARNNQLNGRERLLWTALFSIANDRAIYNAQTRVYEWPGDFFPVPNGELTLHSTLDKRGIESVRNSLKQRGLIDFHAGFKNKKPAEYKINYLSVDVGYKIVPNDVPNNAPNSVPKDVPNVVPNNVPNNAPFIIDINNLQNGGSLFIPSDDVPDGARAEKAIDDYLHFSELRLEEFFAQTPELEEQLYHATAYLFSQFGGRKATRNDAAYVLVATRAYDGKTYYMDSDRMQLLTYCFDQASRKGCPGNWRYINGCMRNLYGRGIKNLNDLDDYESGEFGAQRFEGNAV